MRNRPQQRDLLTAIVMVGVMLFLCLGLALKWFQDAGIEWAFAIIRWYTVLYFASKVPDGVSKVVELLLKLKGKP